MDYKQQKIFNDICKYFHIKRNENTIFIQYRNLNEFKHFDIEKINPTHKIKLYGTLKNKYINDGYYNKIINVGQIILCLGLLFNPFNIVIFNLLFGLAFYIHMFNLIKYDWDKCIYVNWNKLNNFNKNYERLPINI